MVRLAERLPPPWLVGTVASIFLLQVAVTLARPVSTYRLLALGADGIHPRPDSRVLRSPADAARGRLRTVDRATPSGDPACRRSRHRRPGGVRPRRSPRTSRPSRSATTALGIGHMSGTIGGAEHHGAGGQLARAHQQVRHAHHRLGARPDRRPGTGRGDHRPQRRAQPRVDLLGPADRGLGLRRRSARRRPGDAHPDPGVDRPHGPGRARCGAFSAGGGCRPH